MKTLKQRKREKENEILAGDCGQTYFAAVAEIERTIHPNQSSHESEHKSGNLVFLTLLFLRFVFIFLYFLVPPPCCCNFNFKNENIVVNLKHCKDECKGEV